MQDVIGSYVVYDPTGRDMPECFEVGRVTGAYFTEEDDGNRDGMPRVILNVRPNGPSYSPTIAVTTIHAVIAEDQAEEITARLAYAQRLISAGRLLSGIRSDVEDRAVVPAILEQVLSHLDMAGDYIDSAIGVLLPDSEHIPVPLS